MATNKYTCFECGGLITQEDRERDADDYFHYSCGRAAIARAEYMAEYGDDD